MNLIEQLGLEHPVVQAGMGGGIATARLAGAVSAAGALGTVGILPPPVLEAELEQARELAGGRPVAANLLVPFVARGHVEVCRKAGVPVVVLHAGFDPALIRQLVTGGALVLQTVGTAADAHRALTEGATGIVLQGREAGGHLVGVEPALDALPRIREMAGDAPVVLAGGIADSDDTRRALAAGATAVVAGTRFLLTDECAAHPDYKQRALDADRTIETQLFGLGWPMRHRVVPNAATDRWCRDDPLGPRAVRAVQALSTPIQRLPRSMTRGIISVQRPAIPLFGPTPPLAGMPARLIDASPLYAGETALRIRSVIPAGEAVALLAGIGATDSGPTDPHRSPTIPTS